MIVDTHSHLNFDDYNVDRQEVVKRTLEQHIQCINVGVDFKTSQSAIALAENQEGFFAAIGLHPTDTDELLDIKKYQKLATSKKVVAIGEIGLDFFRKPYDVKKQQHIFLQQIDLARELHLPVIIHCRAAHDETIEILTSYILNHKSLTGVIHCFTGTLEQAKKYVELGFFLGIGGIIFKFNIDKVIKEIPLEKLLLETDCPFLIPGPAIEQAGIPAKGLGAPTPEGKKRNEPMFIKHTIQKIADLKGLTFQEICQQTTSNAKVLFGL